MIRASLCECSLKYEFTFHDREIASNHVASLFFLPFIIFFAKFPEAGAAVVLSVAVMWGIAIWRLRKIIWAKHDRILPLGRLWCVSV